MMYLEMGSAEQMQGDPQQHAAGPANRTRESLRTLRRQAAAHVDRT
jgi:hypothetical protein